MAMVGAVVINISFTRSLPLYLACHDMATFFAPHQLHQRLGDIDRGIELFLCCPNALYFLASHKSFVGDKGWPLGVLYLHYLAINPPALAVGGINQDVFEHLVGDMFLYSNSPAVTVLIRNSPLILPANTFLKANLLKVFARIITCLV